MKIGIDIDATICTDCDENTPEALSDEWKSSIKNSNAIPYAVNIINSLIDQGHEIFFISSRYSSDRDVTEQWMKKHRIGKHVLCLRLPELYGPQFKRILIGSLGLDVYIDDKPRLIEIAKELVRYPILFDNWLIVQLKLEYIGAL